MKRFLIKTAIFLALFIAICFVLEFLTTNGLYRTQRDPFNNWNLIREGKLEADITVVGSSRALYHYDPRVLDEETGLYSYNLGITGARLHVLKANWDYYLNNCKPPKYLLINVDLTAFEPNTDLISKLQFMPYLDDPVVHEPLFAIKPEWQKDLYLPLYRYHGYPEIIQQGAKDYFFDRQSAPVRVKGFLWRDRVYPDDEVLEPMHFPHHYHTYPILPQLLERCMQMGIKAALIFSPEYYPSQARIVEREETFHMFREIAKAYDVPFLDYSDHPMCKDVQYFFDTQHLSTAGAKHFTRELARDLIEMGFIEPGQ